MKHDRSYNNDNDRWAVFPVYLHPDECTENRAIFVSRRRGFDGFKETTAWAKRSGRAPSSVVVDVLREVAP